MEAIELLWRYQNLEKQQEQLKNKLKQNLVAESLRELKRYIESGLKEYKTNKSKYKELKYEMDKGEKILTELRKQLDEKEAKLFDGSITNSREIEGMQQKLTAFKEKVEKAEDDQLAIMEKEEELKTKLNLLSGEIKAKNEEYMKLREEYMVETEENKEKQKSLTEEIDHLAKEIDSESMFVYKKMKLKFKDPVAMVKKQICTGCHIELTKHKLVQIRNNSGLIKCDNCGRLVFVE